ncbi:hypothetical protein DFH06DRAFT_379345 [Mycena polygramma]|nr:hypothetical protein DFH06DRAFT_379345 [Mycena polygramma]
MRRLSQDLSPWIRRSIIVPVAPPTRVARCAPSLLCPPSRFPVLSRVIPPTSTSVKTPRVAILYAGRSSGSHNRLGRFAISRRDIVVWDAQVNAIMRADPLAYLVAQAAPGFEERRVWSLGGTSFFHVYSAGYTDRGRVVWRRDSLRCLRVPHAPPPFALRLRPSLLLRPSLPLPPF